MASTNATITRWTRAMVAAGIAFFLAWHLTVLAGFPRSATVVLGLFGFVFHVVFGKAYALVPSYFARELAVPVAPAVHLPLSGLGTVAAFVGEAGLAPPAVGALGATAWLAGALVFVGTIVWTVRDNPTGAETGTGTADHHRERVDRVANAAVPLVLAYLLVGAALAVHDAWSLGGTRGSTWLAVVPAGPGRTHLLAAGAAALLVFAVGFRLLPRLLVASPRPWLVRIVLAAGAAGPALLAGDLHGGRPFQAGASLQALALVGFAVAYADLYRRSDRRRVGGWTVLAAAGFGVVVALLGLSFAAGYVDAAAFEAHYRLAVGGFLGLTIVGVTVHFYPPPIAATPFVDDRTTTGAVLALVAGLSVEAVGLIGGPSELVTGGRALSVLGAFAYAVVLWALFLERRG